jgi:hypothetical protein
VGPLVGLRMANGPVKRDPVPRTWCGIRCSGRSIEGIGQGPFKKGQALGSSHGSEWASRPAACCGELARPKRAPQVRGCSQCERARRGTSRSKGKGAGAAQQAPTKFLYDIMRKFRMQSQHGLHYRL